MALDTFDPYLFVSAGEQSNKFLTPTYADGIAQFQAQRAQSLTGLTVRIDPIQEGTGDPSPTNIRPISGRTGLTVTVQSGDTQNTYPISWQTEAGAIYGGTLNVTTGVLTVDTILATISSFANDNANWSNDSTIAVSGNILATARDGAKRATAVSNILPNAIKYGIDTAVGGASTTTPCFGFNANDDYAKYIYARFPKTVGTTIAEINAYLAEHPLIIAYAIPTTQTYQLSPTEIKTLLGGNTIYTDAGSVSVEYVADTKLYIDGKVAELQALILEN